MNYEPNTVSGIKELNVPLLTMIAEWLEEGAMPRGNVAGFSMRAFVDEDECGTACCIGGAAIAFTGLADKIEEMGGPLLAAASVLGIDDDEVAEELFLARYSGVEDLADIDPAWAARTIRRLIETGDVDWGATAPAA